MPLHWLLLSVPILIGINAFFVAAEYAVVATRSMHIDALRRAGKTRTADAMVKLRRDAASTIGTIQVCITMTNLLLGWLGEPAMSRLLRGALGPLVDWVPPAVFTPLSLVVSFTTVTLLTVVFSELLPKAMTLRYVVVAAAYTAQPIRVIAGFVWPLVWLMNHLANLVTRPLGLGRVDEPDDQRVTTAEIRLLTSEAAADGELTPPERAVILNALTLADRSASQIMVPRVRVAYLDLKRSMEDNRKIINQRLYSRLPLCDGGMDNVVGILHSKEFLSAYNAAGDVTVLSLIAREPVFVPETMSLDKLLSLFAEKHIQMVIALDEYGGCSGVATLRDVIDSLLGSRAAALAAVDAGTHPAGAVAATASFTVPGDMPVHDLAQRMNLHHWCSDKSAATVGGLIQDHLGRFPVVDDVVELEKVRLRVLEADPRRVLHMEVTPPVVPAA